MAIGILQSRHPGLDHRLKLHHVEMPPAPRLGSVQVQALLGFRIGPDPLDALHLHRDALRLQIDPHLFDLPRRLNSKGMGEEILVVHPLL